MGTDGSALLEPPRVSEGLGAAQTLADAVGIHLTARELELLAALMAALRFTSLGLRMRAVTQNRRMASAMGIRNAVVRKLAVAELTTTVLTMTVTGLASDGKPWPQPHDRVWTAGANFYLVKPLQQEALAEYAAMLCGAAG